MFKQKASDIKDSQAAPNQAVSTLLEKTIEISEVQLKMAFNPKLFELVSKTTLKMNECLEKDALIEQKIAKVKEL